MATTEPPRSPLPHVLFLFVAFAVGVLAGHFGRKILEPESEPPPPAVAESPAQPIPDPPPELILTPTAFADLPGWPGAPAGALPALLKSCRAFGRLPTAREIVFGDGAARRTMGDWRAPCAAARKVPSGDDEAARRFFESQFTPYAATNRDEPVGLFTGYYEPTLQGSRRPTERYRVPLYVRPPELVAVDLGAFREDLSGRRIAGRVEGRSLVPFADRRDIHEGALQGRDLELLWVDDPVDAFFLEIQGSGVVDLETGERVRVGYAAQNGHPYYAIGRELVARGAMPVEEVSMQSIRRWLEENPEQAVDVMRTNASYVFFRELDRDGSLGAQGVVLTPGRSLAVDRAFWPLGVPMWLDTQVPAADPSRDPEPMQRLMVAQDTGGAIRGPVRGDVFFGPGDEAAARAGRMRSDGRLWVLLPK